MSYLENFEVVLLDMGDTFMFDCDRFHDIDELTKIIDENEFLVDREFAFRKINHIFE